jgi:hypothetical protein
MAKRNKMWLIGRATRFIPRSSPITLELSNLMYKLLLTKFVDFQKWPETEKVSQEQFETAFNQTQELIDAYLDIYTKQAEFFLCKITCDQFIFSYWIMYSNNKIVFLFYNRIQLIIA